MVVRRNLFIDKITKAKGPTSRGRGRGEMLYIYSRARFSFSCGRPCVSAFFRVGARRAISPWERIRMSNPHDMPHHLPHDLSHAGSYPYDRQYQQFSKLVYFLSQALLPLSCYDTVFESLRSAGSPVWSLWALNLSLVDGK